MNVDPMNPTQPVLDADLDPVLGQILEGYLIAL